MSDITTDKIKTLLVERLEITPDRIKPEARLSDDLGLDSLDAMELLIAINEELGVSIPQEALEKINTFQQLVDAATNKK